MKMYKRRGVTIKGQPVVGNEEDRVAVVQNCGN